MNVLTLALLAAVTTTAPDPAARAISLDEAVSLARSRALSVIQAQGQLRNRRADVLSSTGAFLPQLSLGASSSRPLPGDPVTWNSSTTFSADLTLFAGGSRWFDLQSARQQVSAAAADVDAAAWGAGLVAEQAYFDVLAARETREAADAQLEQADQQLRVAIVRLRARDVTRSDSLRAEIQRHGARVAQVQADTDLRLAEANLARAIGSDAPVTAAAEDSLDESPLPADDATLLGWVLQGPAVRAAAAAADGAHQTLRAAWSTWLPSVTASYSRSGSGAGDHPSLGTDGFDYGGRLGLSVSLPIFDQFQRRASVTRAEVGRDDADAALADARRAATASFIQSRGAFGAALEQVAVQRATLDAAREDLRVQQQLYAVGSATVLDVLTSQTTLDDARLALVRTRHDLRVARAQLEALAGRSLRS